MAVDKCNLCIDLWEKKEYAAYQIQQAKDRLASYEKDLSSMEVNLSILKADKKETNLDLVELWQVPTSQRNQAWDNQEQRYFDKLRSIKNDIEYLGVKINIAEDWINSAKEDVAAKEAIQRNIIIRILQCETCN